MMNMIIKKETYQKGATFSKAWWMVTDESDV